MKRAADVAVWLAGVAAATAVVLLFTLEGGGDNPTSSRDNANTETLGAIVYGRYCAQCHGDEGQGGTGPAFTGQLVATFPDPAEQTAVILIGRRTMPAFADLLTPEEVDAVVEFTRVEFG